MIRIEIKPLSVNAAYNGKRTRSKAYNNYINNVTPQLKKIALPMPPLSLTYEFGLSSKGFDIDNAVKPITDILQKRYGFNDNQVYELHVVKKIVKKGYEYIKFKIESL
jgi:Holliday junction resolvase RusA-like endonuclease